MDRLALPVACGFIGVPIITAAPQKCLRFRVQNGLNRGADMVSQTTLNRIIARFLGKQRKRGSVNHSVTFPAVAATGWVASSHPKMRPPSNFHHIHDTTDHDPSETDRLICGLPARQLLAIFRRLQAIDRRAVDRVFDADVLRNAP